MSIDHELIQALHAAYDRGATCTELIDLIHEQRGMTKYSRGATLRLFTAFEISIVEANANIMACALFEDHPSAPTAAECDAWFASRPREKIRPEEWKPVSSGGYHRGEIRDEDER